MLPSLTRSARRLVKPLSAAVDLVAEPTPGLTILIYHRVGGGTSSVVDLDVARFADQMAELAESGRVVALDTGLDYLRGVDVGTTEPVVITFDDGTPDVFEHALPVLDDLDLPMTLYLATRFVDEERPFWGPEDEPLTWTTVVDGLASPGLSIGSHTHSHALLDRIGPTEVANELDRSIGLIEERTGVSPRHFAYPKALAPTPDAAAAVAARFESAALAGTHANPVGTDPYSLARSPVQRTDGMRWFRRKARGGLGFEDRLRSAVNRHRDGAADG